MSYSSNQFTGAADAPDPPAQAVGPIPLCTTNIYLKVCSWPWELSDAAACTAHKQCIAWGYLRTDLLAKALPCLPGPTCSVVCPAGHCCTHQQATLLSKRWGRAHACASLL